MSNPYVLGGYLAVAAILGVYVWHLRRRARVLARNLPGRAAASVASSSSFLSAPTARSDGDQGPPS
jgi:hypothetical protein